MYASVRRQCRKKIIVRASVRYFIRGEGLMNNIVYIVGLIVIVIAVLSFFGLR